MKRPGLLLLLLILSADVFVAQPQRIPTPGALFREWMASQQEQRRPLTRIAFTESMARSTDSFFGSRRLEMELEVTGYLQEDRWERLPRRARLNGQEVGPERWDQVERSLQQGAQQGFDDMLETFSLPLRLIRNLRPVGSTATETLKGVACWRFDMVPESPNGRIERMTLWFDQDAHRLVQAQAQARGGRNRGTHTLRLSFQRFEGFDLPVERHLEGNTQMNRRGRFYTVMLRATTVFSNYQLFYD
jgi:hypothetical protein